MDNELFVKNVLDYIKTKNKGVLIILNGMDGAGKGVQFERLKQSFNEYVSLREPGGTKEAEKIREIILNSDMTLHQRLMILNELRNEEKVTELCKEYLTLAFGEMCMDGLTGTAEKYLFAASRAQTNSTLVKPSIENRKVVLGERSVACSMAYQGFARGLGMDKVWEANQNAIVETMPNLEIFLDVEPNIAQERLKGRTEKQDRLDKESFEFHKKTREGYMTFYKEYCPYSYDIIDAGGSIEETYEKIKESIINHFKTDSD